MTFPFRKLILICLASLLCLTISTDSAFAKRGGKARSLPRVLVIGSYHTANLAFTVEKSADLAGYTGCRVLKTFHLFALPVLRYPVAYAASSDGTCALSKLRQQFTEAGIIALKNSGDIPSDTPLTPRLTWKERLEGHSLTIVVLIYSIGKWLQARSRKRSKVDRSNRQKLLGIKDAHTFNLIDVMCHAVASNGVIEDAEVAYIRRVAEGMTRQDYRSEHIRNAIRHCTMRPSKKLFQMFAHDVNGERRAAILHHSIGVVTASGSFSKREQRFMSRLIKALRIPKSQLNAALEKVVPDYEAAVEQHLEEKRHALA